MTCFSIVQLDPLLFLISGLLAASVVVLMWIWRFHEFEGKQYFILSLCAIIWWVFSIGMEVAVFGLHCKLTWARFAWPAIAVLPMAWSLYIECFVRGKDLSKNPGKKYLIFGLAFLISLGSLTDPWHQLLFSEGTTLSTDQARVKYVHGPIFYFAALLLYPFILRALWILIQAVLAASGSAKSLLVILIAITCIPLIANTTYVVGKFTVLGIDPTPLMFSVGIIAFSWMLLTNRMIDTEALGRDALFHNSEDPVLIFDAQQKLISWNNAAEKCGFVKKQSKGSHIQQIPGLCPSLISELQSRGVTFRDQQIHAFGRVYEPKAIPVLSSLDPERRHIAWSITLIDITERVNFAESLRLALEDAEQAAMAKDNFLAVVSHELRTPMTSLKGGVDLVVSGQIGSIPPSVNNLLMVVQRNANRLSKLINDVLDVQKMAFEKLEIESSRVNLSQLLNDAIEENQQMARLRGVSLVRKDLQCTSPVVMGDSFRLRQVIDNVISNAIKFSPQGESSIEVWLSVQEGCARISVRDYGCGIPKGSEDIVFGLFSQVDGSSTRSGDGTGLGMYISRRIIEQMSGRLTYESAENRGTVFYIELPCSEEN